MTEGAGVLSRLLQLEDSGVRHESVLSFFVMPDGANVGFFLIFGLYFLLNEECPKLLSGLGIDHRRRKTIPLSNSSGNERVLQGINVCLVSTILGTV